MAASTASPASIPITHEGQPVEDPCDVGTFAAALPPPPDDGVPPVPFAPVGEVAFAPGEGPDPPLEPPEPDPVPPEPDPVPPEPPPEDPFPPAAPPEPVPFPDPLPPDDPFPPPPPPSLPLPPPSSDPFPSAGRTDEAWDTIVLPLPRARGAPGGPDQVTTRARAPRLATPSAKRIAQRRCPRRRGIREVEVVGSFGRADEFPVIETKGRGRVEKAWAKIRRRNAVGTPRAGVNVAYLAPSARGSLDAISASSRVGEEDPVPRMILSQEFQQMYIAHPEV
jgi:hypothetical protein